MIDPDLLPKRALLDSSVFFGGLSSRAKGPLAEECREFLRVMLEHRRTVLVATPTITELLRGQDVIEPPRTRGVVIVSFDEPAARLLGEKFPASTLVRLRDQLGAPLQYIKYDALIVACALRHRADSVITMDAGIKALASHVGIKAQSPCDFASKQLSLRLVRSGLRKV